jgi:uncharacterized protein YjbI with pentapeptide repeats
MTKELFTIARRLGWSMSGEIKVEIECDPTTPGPIKLGLAVRVAVKSRANLSGADLSGANLSGADLSGADLSRADLSRAYLSRANLSGAYLSGAYLSGADLSGADLSRAYLSGANLSGAYLSGAYLSGADLSGADLSGADLSGANLSGANLSGADLSRADLSRAYLSGANLSGAYLSGANLSGADLSGADLSRADLSGANLSDEALRTFKADMWLTLTEATDPNEIRFLIAALRAGAVDGSTYGDGKTCACLVGTLARFQREGGEGRDHSSDRPAERWFMMIRVGDVPGKTAEDGKETGGGFAARKALEWAEAWCAAVGVDPVFPANALVEIPPIMASVEDAA